MTTTSLILPPGIGKKRGKRGPYRKKVNPPPEPEKLPCTGKECVDLLCKLCELTGKCVCNNGQTQA